MSFNISAFIERKRIIEIDRIIILKTNQKLFDSAILLLNSNVFCCHSNDVHQLPLSENECEDSLNICIETQLVSWVRHDSTSILKALKKLRVDRDIDVICIAQWNEHADIYNRLVNIAQIIQKQQIDLKSKNNDLLTQNLQLTIENATLQINFEKIDINVFSSEVIIRKDKKRSAKISNSSKFSQNTSKLPYEIWKQLTRDKLTINNDHYFTNQMKILTVSLWLDEIARDHVFARRKFDSLFFKIVDEVFILLISVFVEKNVDRIVRNKFKNLKMNINQRFSNFFSKFVLLSNQLSNYFQQILTNELREKLTSTLQRVIVSNDKFSDVNFLKKLIESVNQKLHSLKNYQIIKIEIFTRVNQSFSKRNIVKSFTRTSIFSTFKRFSVFELTTLKSLQIKEKTSSNCYKCEVLDHWSKDCSKSESLVIYIQKILRKKKNALKIHNIVDFIFKNSTQLSQTFANDEVSETSDEFSSEHESKNV